MEFSKTLFRASSVGYLMVEPKSKADKEAGNLSESAKTHLVDVFVSNKYGRNTDISNKYIQKGLMVEEDSITLYSRVKKSFFRKNEEHLKNEWVQGTPDLYVGDSISEATVIIDTKSAWDIFSYFRNGTKELNQLYYWQLQAYMDLTGAKDGIIAFCLVDTPEILINDEKRKLMYKMGVATDMNEDYMQACEELDRLMRYEDIPIQNRVFEVKVPRSQEDIDRMHRKIERAREELQNLDSSFI